MKTIEEKVREDAKRALDTKLNLVQYKREKNLANMHKIACMQVVEFADRHAEMPFYAVLSSAIGSGAWKTSEYEKGYVKADLVKAEQIYQMAKAYNEKNNIKGEPSDVVWRIVRRYYDKVSRSFEDYMKALKNSKPSDGKRGHYKEQCENLGIYK